MECEKKGKGQTKFNDECINAFRTDEEISNQVKKYKDRLTAAAIEGTCVLDYNKILKSIKKDEEMFCKPFIVNALPVLRGVETITLADVLNLFYVLDDVRVINGLDLSTCDCKLGEYSKYLTHAAPNKAPYCCLSLELSKTRMRDRVILPELVQELNMMRDVKEYEKGSTNVVRYFLHFMEGSFVGFHLDMSGSSIWHHVLEGQEVLYIIHSSTKIGKIYDQWVKNKRTENLLDLLPGDVVIEKITVGKGQTLFLPGGYLRATLTPVETFILGGNFLSFGNAEIQFSAYNMEVAADEDEYYRFPNFKDWNARVMAMLRNKMSQGEDLTLPEKNFCKAAEEGMKKWEITKTNFDKFKEQYKESKKMQLEEIKDGGQTRVMITRSSSRRAETQGEAPRP